MIKPLIIGIIVAAGVGAIALNAQYQNTKGTRTMRSQQAVHQTLKQRLGALQDAKLKVTSCKLLFRSLDMTGSTCYVSMVKPDDLLSLLDEHLAEVADTTGWSNDYSVWGAFFKLRDDSRWPFGVIIKSIPNSEDFDEVKEVEGYESFVTLTVNDTNQQ